MANPSKLQLQIVARKEMTISKGGVSQVHVFEKCRKSAKIMWEELNYLKRLFFFNESGY